MDSTSFNNIAFFIKGFPSDFYLFISSFHHDMLPRMKLLRFLNKHTYLLPASLLSIALVLLHQRAFHYGAAQSFDAMLYVRSLWGMGRGDFFNSVMQTNSLAIHGHFLLVLLAPFTHVTSAMNLLIWAQSIALGVTVALATKAFLQQHLTRVNNGLNWKALPLSIFFTAMISLGSPLILNPFLFDVHPGLLGVPFCVAGLLRGVRKNGFDKWSVFFLFLSILGREEFALVSAGALLFLGISSRNEGIRFKYRAILAAAFCVYFGVYWFVARGFNLSSAQLLMVGSDIDIDFQHVVYHKAIMMGLLVTSVGGWALWGWRWLGAAVFGTFFLLWNRWLLEGQIRYQYSMFVAPGILAAAVWGYQKIVQKSIRVQIGMISLSVVLASLAFMYFSAFPGGKQFQASNFAMSNGAGGMHWDLQKNNPLVEQANQLLLAIPKEAGLSVPYAFGAIVADREYIWPNFKLVAHIQQHHKFPQHIDTVVLYRGDLATVGRYLMVNEGFRLVNNSGPLATLKKK